MRGKGKAHNQVEGDCGCSYGRFTAGHGICRKVAGYGWIGGLVWWIPAEGLGGEVAQSRQEMWRPQQQEEAWKRRRRCEARKRDFSLHIFSNIY